MKTYRLALIGFGNVGQGLAQILLDKDYAIDFGAEFKVVAVCDLLQGSVYDPQGLEIATLLKTVRETGKLDAVDAPQRDWDATQTITATNADVIVELSYTDLQTGEPALTHVRTALENGKHVVTTNKGPVALHYPELRDLAKQHGVEIGVEGTVMSGTPALRVGLELLAAAGITRIQGILNGTTNYILTQMENGTSYDDALADAQAKGYAEADPTGDVEGHDAVGKVVILANMLMNVPLKIADVDRTGISGLTLEDIAEAQAHNERWKLIGTLEHINGNVQASVKPVQMSLNHPLASVGGATNAITYTTDLLGDVTLVGAGAGRIETGYALIGDLMAIHRRNA